MDSMVIQLQKLACSVSLLVIPVPMIYRLAAFCAILMQLMSEENAYAMKLIMEFQKLVSQLKLVMTAKAVMLDVQRVRETYQTSVLNA